MTDAILDTLQDELGWPKHDTIFSPEVGTGAFYARLAKQKIGQGLQEIVGPGGVEVGVLVRDPQGTASDLPLAVVCRFTSPASASILAETHRLAWNFCHAPLLITIDPVEIRAWSCFVAPSETFGVLDSKPAELNLKLREEPSAGLIGQAANALHWVSLISGEPERLNPQLFNAVGRADRHLLENLKEVRTRLISGPNALPVDQAHDLIARLMFIQFLFDRRDSTGYAALSPQALEELTQQGHLARAHNSLHSILSDHSETYRLFRWLNDRFNGDLFPGKSATPAEREREWLQEMEIVRPSHLQILADLVSGQLSVEYGQYSLWRLYSFDTIPLEFVSSIYEEFVSAKPEPKSKRKGAPRARKVGSAHYTPSHLADYVLDAVLPWADDDWRVRVLDPSCGSGIFLVRAFQRLVYRWRLHNPGCEVPVAVLRELLENYICGIDINPQAVRVASFSLYLAMCDEIEPRRYWTETRFPKLRGVTLVAEDFFKAERWGAFAESFDVVVGNAPWGIESISDHASIWAVGKKVTVDNKDIGPLFLLYGAEWLREGGELAMIQSAKAVLTGARSARLRTLLADLYRIDEITNFTLLRFNLFRDATSPACCVVLTRTETRDQPVTYICPKRNGSSDDDFRIIYDTMDVNAVYPEEIADPLIWNVLVVGGRRDLTLVRRIKAASVALDEIENITDFEIGEGVIVGNESSMPAYLQDRRILPKSGFPPGTGRYLDVSGLPRRKTFAVERGRTETLFTTPQLLIRQSWDSDKLRYDAALVRGNEGVVCTQSYVSVHARTEKAAVFLTALCDSLHSPLMSYYLAMTNGRMAYRPELLVRDLKTMPVFPVDGLHLNEAEEALIDDAMKFSIPELVKDESAWAQSSTDREGGLVEAFCDYYLRVLDPMNGLSPNATIFRENETDLPLRMIAIHLAPIDDQRIRYETFGTGVLRHRLVELHTMLLSTSSGSQPGKIATVYDVVTTPDGRNVPTIYLIRPDRNRFWSRTAALREADRLVMQELFGSIGSQGGVKS